MAIIEGAQKLNVTTKAFMHTILVVVILDPGCLSAADS